MKIEKALKKQKRYNKLFIIFMFFLAIFLPIITYLAYIRTFTMLAFLLLIEILIFISIIRKVNDYTLNFICANNKLKFRDGLFSSYTYIQCDRIAIVHTNKNNEDMEIIVVTRGKVKNQKMKLINKEFMKKYEEAGIDGLLDLRGRTKPVDEMSELERLRMENRLLKAQNKRQEMEMNFLKKLDEIERRWD